MVAPPLLPPVEVSVPPVVPVVPSVVEVVPVVEVEVVSVVEPVVESVVLLEVVTVVVGAVVEVAESSPVELSDSEAPSSPHAMSRQHDARRDARVRGDIAREASTVRRSASGPLSDLCVTTALSGGHGAAMQDATGSAKETVE